MSEEKEKEKEKEKEEKRPDINNKLSRVAVSAEQSAFVLSVILAIGSVFLYKSYKSNLLEGQKNVAIPVPKEVAITSFEAPLDGELPEVPAIPEIVVSSFNNLQPKVEVLEKVEEKEEFKPEIKPIITLEEKKEVLPAPPVISPPAPPVVARNDNVRNNLDNQTSSVEGLSQRKKSSIMLISGDLPVMKDNKISEQQDSYADFEKLGDISRVLPKGTIIEAILTGGIDSKNVAMIEAVISKDVYSMNNDNILIPKGSKIYGNFTASIKSNYARVNIDWNRVELITGYIMKFQGKVVDALGRGGVNGILDRKYLERITNVLLNSALNIGVAKGIDKIIKPPVKDNQALDNKMLSNSIRSTVQNVILNSSGYPNDNAKVTAICSQLISIISGRNNAGFTQIIEECNSTSVVQDNIKLQNVIRVANLAADSIIINVSENLDPTKAQEAAKDAFVDITDIIKEIIQERDLTPLISVKPGTRVDIMVDKDFLFPKSTFKQVRYIK